MNETIIKENVRIENLIYEIRGKQVMPDSDLAKLYGTETRRINEAVSRNLEKFPDRYCFKISENEYNSLKSQVAASKGGSRKEHKTFSITLVNDSEILKVLICKINELEKENNNERK